MKTIRYNARPRHVLRDGDVLIPGGEEREVPNEVAERLLASPHVDVSEVVDTTTPPADRPTNDNPAEPDEEETD